MKTVSGFSLIPIVLLLFSCQGKINMSKVDDEIMKSLAMLKKGTWIDLTWSFDEKSVYWPTNIPFSHEKVFRRVQR
jgi:hypothetical protein